MIPRPKEAAPPIDLAARHAELLAVERVRRGDALALEMIFTAFRAELLSLARSRVGSPAIAEEVVQDVFLAIWTGRERWEIRTSLCAYLRRAVHNVASRAGASRTRGLSPDISLDEAVSVVPAHFADTAPAPDVRAELAALADAVERATHEMSPRARDVFTLSRMSDLSNREIAARLGVSVKTVETHMTRALAFLRRRLGGWRG